MPLRKLHTLIYKTFIIAESFSKFGCQLVSRLELSCHIFNFSHEFGIFFSFCGYCVSVAVFTRNSTCHSLDYFSLAQLFCEAPSIFSNFSQYFLHINSPHKINPYSLRPPSSSPNYCTFPYLITIFMEYEHNILQNTQNNYNNSILNCIILQKSFSIAV